MQCVFDVGVREDTPELRQSYADVKHYLFEPVAEFHPAIERNYRSVEHELIGLAASDAASIGMLSTHSVESEALVTHSTLVTDASQSKGRDVRSVETVRLDDFIESRRITGPIFLKIDVDGNELKVMEGARGAIPKIPVVIMEASRSFFADRVRFMDECGYRIFDIIGLCYYQDIFHQADLVFMRKNLIDTHSFNAWERGPFDAMRWSQI